MEMKLELVPLSCRRKRAAACQLGDNRSDNKKLPLLRS